MTMVSVREKREVKKTGGRRVVTLLSPVDVQAYTSLSFPHS